MMQKKPKKAQRTGSDVYQIGPQNVGPRFLEEKEGMRQHVRYLWFGVRR